MASRSDAAVPTKVLILSDTHGKKFDASWSKPIATFDLAMHCGDLTEGSTLSEFHDSLELLRSINASMKVVIAGNHEITLDEDTYRKHLEASGLDPNDTAAVKTYGSLGKARDLLLTTDDNILLLDEGMHTLSLPNGATITIYASSWTPRRESGALDASEAGWAFQYDRSDGHQYNISMSPDVILTHGPPEGILDYVNGRRAGCPDLFKAAAQARPQLHCFGHVHAGWGARLVTWRDEAPSENLSHFSAIDHDTSKVIRRLSDLKASHFDDESTRERKRKTAQKLLAQGHCDIDLHAPIGENQTLFVNAAIEGDDELPVQPPLSVILQLSPA